MIKDSLDDVLRDLRLNGIAYGQCALAAPWGLSFAGDGMSRFHYVARGRAWLKGEDGDWMVLKAGDFVLVRPGQAHYVACAPGARTVPVEELDFDNVAERMFALRHAPEAPDAMLFCGKMDFAAGALGPLMALMPAFMTVCCATAVDPVVKTLLDAMGDEMNADLPGGGPMMTRLADLMVLRMVRAWALRDCGDTGGWQAAVREPRIGRALMSVHRDPGGTWTVGTMAQAAGMSRSVFAERFSEAMGETPVQYVTGLRMKLAGEWLRDGRASVSAVAGRLGYESEASFSRAFKRVTGKSPGGVRRGEAEIQAAQ